MWCIIGNISLQMVEHDEISFPIFFCIYTQWSEKRRDSFQLYYLRNNKTFIGRFHTHWTPCNFVNKIYNFRLFPQWKVSNHCSLATSTAAMPTHFLKQQDSQTNKQSPSPTSHTNTHIHAYTDIKSLNGPSSFGEAAL